MEAKLWKWGQRGDIKKTNASDLHLFSLHSIETIESRISDHWIGEEHTEHKRIAGIIMKLKEKFQPIKTTGGNKMAASRRPHSNSNHLNDNEST